jgi:hypothetical protein
MNFSIVSLLLVVSSASGFMGVAAPAAPPTSRMASTLKMTNAVETESFVKSDRVILENLPVLHVYDHCPFCVRVRVALGIKNVKHIINFMANDDIPTPTKLVGKKIAPIFVRIQLR